MGLCLPFIIPKGFKATEFIYIIQVFSICDTLIFLLLALNGPNLILGPT